MVLRSLPPLDSDEARRMWHITLLVMGSPKPMDDVRDALERLNLEHPFLLEARYAPDRAEIRYWEEATDMATAAEVGGRMWSELQRPARLPSWDVIDLRVRERDFYLEQRSLRVVPHGGRIVPFTF